jgi:hypothetical protein
LAEAQQKSAGRWRFGATYGFFMRDRCRLDQVTLAAARKEDGNADGGQWYSSRFLPFGQRD